MSTEGVKLTSHMILKFKLFFLLLHYSQSNWKVVMVFRIGALTLQPLTEKKMDVFRKQGGSLVCNHSILTSLDVPRLAKQIFLDLGLVSFGYTLTKHIPGCQAKKNPIKQHKVAGMIGKPHFFRYLRVPICGWYPPV